MRDVPHPREIRCVISGPRGDCDVKGEIPWGSHLDLIVFFYLLVDILNPSTWILIPCPVYAFSLNGKFQRLLLWTFHCPPLHDLNHSPLLVIFNIIIVFVTSTLLLLNSLHKIGLIPNMILLLARISSKLIRSR